MEQIGHRVDEHTARVTPAKRRVKAFRSKREVEATFEGMTANTSEPLGKRPCVTVIASRTDLCTPSHWVPRGVGPLDRCPLAHGVTVNLSSINDWSDGPNPFGASATAR